MDDSEVKVFMERLLKANELLQEKGAKKQVTGLLKQFVGGEFSGYIMSLPGSAYVVDNDSNGWATVSKILKGGNSNG